MITVLRDARRLWLPVWIIFVWLVWTIPTIAYVYAETTSGADLPLLLFYTGAAIGVNLLIQAFKAGRYEYQRSIIITALSGGVLLIPAMLIIFFSPEHPLMNFFITSAALLDICVLSGAVVVLVTSRKPFYLDPLPQQTHLPVGSHEQSIRNVVNSWERNPLLAIPHMGNGISIDRTQELVGYTVSIEALLTIRSISVGKEAIASNKVIDRLSSSGQPIQPTLQDIDAAKWNYVFEPVGNIAQHAPRSPRRKKKGGARCDRCKGTGTSEQECICCGGGGKNHRAVQCNTCNGNRQFDQNCSWCRGKGRVLFWFKCRACGQTGTTRQACPTCKGAGAVLDTSVCSNCAGTKHVRATCEKCHGGGVIERSTVVKTESLRLPGEIPDVFICSACDGAGFSESTRWKTETYQDAAGETQTRQVEVTSISRCDHCKGSGKVAPYLTLTQECKYYYNDTCLDSTAEHKLEGVLYRCEGKVLEIAGTNINFATISPPLPPDVAAIAERLQQEVESLYANAKRVLEQSIKAIEVPITQVEYTYQAKPYRLWICGLNNLVHAEKAPRNIPLLRWFAAACLFLAVVNILPIIVFMVVQ